MIFAIETSCDDTCAAVITPEGEVLSNVVSDQHDVHEVFQGVVPELASRRHCEVITRVLQRAINDAGINWSQLESVAVTFGPGLIGSLLTGIAAAKSIAARFDLPLIPVNHIEGHIYSIGLDNEIEYPFISLVASGGHSALFKVLSPDEYIVLGHTRDDAAGEAYDKVAKMLGLGYPGGPAIETHADLGDPDRFDYPRPTLRGQKRWNWRLDDYDFSFSGIKTAVYYHLKENPDTPANDVAASFQRAVNDTLIFKTLEAADEHEIDRVCIGGGVAANSALREDFIQQGQQRGIQLTIPPKDKCTDNAAMVGFRARMIDNRADLNLNAQPNLSMFSPKSNRSETLAR